MSRPPFARFPVLKNERITMREIMRDEVSDIIEISFYDSKPAKDFAEAKEMLERITNDYMSGNTVHWGIIENVSGKITGTCGYYRGFENDTGEIGCVLLTESRGKGLMTDALKLAINFGFDKLKLLKIKAITSPSNIKAIALLERTCFNKLKSDNENILTFEMIQK